MGDENGLINNPLRPASKPDKKCTRMKRDMNLMLVAAILLISMLFIGLGPAGAARSFSAWKASAWGADWLVVQYNQSGGVIASWELRNSSIGNEIHSDGIYFTNSTGNVVHLSGHYVYTEIQEERWAQARARLLKKEEVSNEKE